MLILIVYFFWIYLLLLLYNSRALQLQDCRRKREKHKGYVNYLWIHTAVFVVICGATTFVAHRCCVDDVSLHLFWAKPPLQKQQKLMILPRRGTNLVRDAIVPFISLLAFVADVRITQKQIFWTIFVYISQQCVRYFLKFWGNFFVN